MASLRSMKEVATRLKDVAFTIKGFAMKDGMHHNGPEYILAYPVSGMQYQSTVKTWLDQQMKPKEIYGAIAPTDEERGEPGTEGISQYLIVGYASRVPAVEDKRFTKQNPNVGRGKMIGVTIPKHVHGTDDVLPWSDKVADCAALVVTEMLDKPRDGTQLWVLLKPENGYRTPYMIAQNLVYYRHEYRESSTSDKARGPAWNRLVSAAALRATPSVKPTVKEVQFRKAKDVAKIIFHPHRSIRNELLQLALMYQSNPDQTFINQMRAVLQAADADLAYGKNDDDYIVRLIATSGKICKPVLYEKLATNIQESWKTPENGFINGHNVKMVHAGILRNKLFVEYRIFRPFMVEACRQFQKRWETESDALDVVDKLVLDALECTKFQHPILDSRPNIDVGVERAMMGTVLNYLRCMHKAWDDFSDQLKASCGSVAFAAVPADIWEHYAKRLDTDATRLAFDGVVQFYFRHVNEKLDCEKEMLMDLINNLEILVHIPENDEDHDMDYDSNE